MSATPAGTVPATEQRRRSGHELRRHPVRRLLRLAAFVQARPLLQRLSRYGAGSLVAAASGETAFTLAYAALHAGTTWASAAGFVGGAVPNYILNRRWAWPDRRNRRPRSEIALYAAVALSAFAASAAGTHWAELGARALSADPALRALLVATAFLGVSAVFFGVKFVLYELVVFPKKARAPHQRSDHLA